jgi:hypothetical protein
VAVTATEDGLSTTVTATVTRDGRPVKGALVNFYESTTMFAPGDNQIPLGAVQTDADGQASLSYTAATTGPRTISASYSPTVLGDPVTASTPLDVKEAVSTYRPTAPPELAGAGGVLIYTLFGLVFLVFVLLVAQVVRVRRACRPA